MSSAGPAVTPVSNRMTGSELRAMISLAGVFALRMLGLFMIMPVFAVFATALPDGGNIQLVAFAIGVYGLTQAVFYIPYGWLSDRFGRKPVIVAGLLIFAAGSLVAALSHSVAGIAMGRAIQGAGAISSAVMALAADLTREAQRTKAMAMIGGSIGLSFAVAIVGAPVAFRWIGLPGMFLMIGALAVMAIVVVLWVVPPAPRAPAHAPAPFREVLRNRDLLRLNFGVFALHAIQTALFVVLPGMLEAAGLPVTAHWRIYLPVMGLSFVLMVPALIAAERHGRMKAVLLTAIAAVAAAQWALGEAPSTLAVLTVALWVYFLGFNVLEASQPSLVSKYAPGARRGAAMGVYNTTQALGLFAGGAGGGWVLLHAGQHAVFWVCAGLAFAWLIIAGPMRVPALRRH